MSASLICIAIAVFALSGVPGLFLRAGSAGIARFQVVLVLAGAAVGLTGAVLGFFKPDPALYEFPWPAFGNALVGVDALSSFFLLPIFLIGSLGAVYSAGYWSPREFPRTGSSMRFFWGLILAGMTLLVISKHVLSFLLGWEAMALSAFFLVSTEDEKSGTRKSGLVYLIATHVGTLSLFGFFALWRAFTGSFDLVPAAPGSISAAAANILLAAGFFGFGLKAGVMPLHFWLPGAHANAPSHVSALLSGVMLKMGVYGIVRTISLVPDIAPFWGWAVLFAGASSGVLGIVFALGQKDFKRLLAYSSIENIGIILLGLGLALLGRVYHRQDWIVLGLGGCLLHVWNHSLFKPLLFLGAGAVMHATGTRQIDELGALARKMPKTALLFLTGSAAICALPPLNGFVSEFMLYLGFFGSALSVERISAIMLLGAPVLAMIGALAVSCFVKLYSAVFLGEPRTESAMHAHEASATMLVPMALLALLCVIVALFPALTVPFLDRAISAVQASVPFTAQAMPLSSLVPFGILGRAMAISVGAMLLLGFVFFFYKKRMERKAGTWDCGFVKPDARIQYTGSSFTRSLTALFRGVLKPREQSPVISGLFPRTSSLESRVDDPVLDRHLIPGSTFIRKKLRWFYRFQHGETHLYLLYVVAALSLLLATLIPYRAIFLFLFAR